MAKKERQSNIELLRILATMGVIILHYNNPLGGGGITSVKNGSLNFYILYILESIFIYAVNLFMLVSGYFMYGQKTRSLWKPVELIIQVVMFREALYLLSVVMGRTAFSIRHILLSAIPANYFVILYCTVYLISPFIAVLMDALSQKGLQTLVYIMFILFSVYPTFVDMLGELRGSEFNGLSSIGMYGSQWGYTVVNFMLMFIIGMSLRKLDTGIFLWKTRKLFICFVILVMVVSVWARMNDRVGFLDVRSAWEYCNPLIILNAVIVFVLFLKIDLGSNKIINKLADGAFSVYLLHSIFLSHLGIEKFVVGNVFVMLVHIMGSVVVIYLICWVAHIMYHFIMDPFLKILHTKIKLPLIDLKEMTGR